MAFFLKLLISGHFSGGQIPADPYSNDPGPSDNQDIESMCVSPAEETLAVSTDRGQLYSISLSAVAVDQVKPHLDRGTRAPDSEVVYHGLWFDFPAGESCIFGPSGPVLPLQGHHWFVRLHPQAHRSHQLSRPLRSNLEL